MTKTVIGTPVGKDHQIDIRTAGYCHLEAQNPNVEWKYASTRSAGSSRNQIAYFAIKDPDVTHVYSVDSDTIPPTGTLQRLLKYDLPIVAGIYPVYVHNELHWSFVVDGAFWPVWKPLPKELIEVEAIGGSTHLNKREVFETIEQPWYQMVLTTIDKNGCDWSHGEDIYFSKKARAAGFKLMVDPTIICDHYNYASLLALGSDYEMVYDKGVQL